MSFSLRSLALLFGLSGLLVGGLTSSPATAADAVFEVKETDEGASVTAGGVPITNYVKQSVSRPILWPIWGPHQVEMTRGYPMREATPDEKNDHIHHRSFWIGHEINGVDFWGETTPKAGMVRHVKFNRLESGPVGIIEAECEWMDQEGKRILTDRRRYSFSGSPELRVLDFDCRLFASEVDLHFLDTKEGMVALRVAEWMKVDAKKGGELVNAEGLKDAEAWGKKASWVDYTGESPDGHTVGIAFLNHPQSFGYPNRWHVRTYGLFSANPIGVYHFTGDKEPTEGVTVKKGDSMELHFRIVLHEGRTDAKAINQWQTKYAESQVPGLKP